MSRNLRQSNQKDEKYILMKTLCNEESSLSVFELLKEFIFFVLKPVLRSICFTTTLERLQERKMTELPNKIVRDGLAPKQLLPGWLRDATTHKFRKNNKVHCYTHPR
jgi:hypothetical protein